MLYFTGSKPHNLHLRLMAIDRGWKNNEYGMFEGEKALAGETEEGMYQSLGLPWIPPELREDTGEIEAAQQGRLPHLVTLDDIRGDLHSHTQASDGRATLEAMADHARQLGYAYLAITDHSRSLRIAHGQSVEALALQIEQIDRLNERWKDFRLLKCCEVDILEDGSLDMPDDILERLDLRVCSIHSRFKMPREKQTERVLRAMDNPNFNIFAHPTGRLLDQRPGYDIDLERVLIGAKERGCYLEINAHPERLDLNDAAARLAKDTGVKLAISTDAHSPGELDYMHFGVDQGRRGWLEPGDVLNTRRWPELKRLLKR
jgi:DNA polymerase (family X)